MQLGFSHSSATLPQIRAMYPVPIHRIQKSFLPFLPSLYHLLFIRLLLYCQRRFTQRCRSMIVENRSPMFSVLAVLHQQKASLLTLPIKILVMAFYRDIWG